MAHSVTNLGGYADVVLKGGLVKQMRAGNLSNELTNTEIMDLVGQLKIPHFQRMFYKNKNPKLKKGESVIINLTESRTGRLSFDWIKYYYLDSYGVIGPTELDKLDYIYSEVNLQDMNSTACGWFCLAFIISMNRGNDGMQMFEEFLFAFKSPSKNDVILKKRFGF
jgi:hypothetical protein